MSNAAMIRATPQTRKPKMTLASADEIAMIEVRPRYDLASSFLPRSLSHAIGDLPPPGRPLRAGHDGRKPPGRRHDRYETRHRRSEIGRRADVPTERYTFRRPPTVRAHLRHRYRR